MSENCNLQVQAREVSDAAFTSHVSKMDSDEKKTCVASTDGSDVRGTYSAEQNARRGATVAQRSKLNCEEKTTVAGSSSLDGSDRWETCAAKEVEWRPSGATKRLFALIGVKSVADVAKCGGPDEVRKAVDTAAKEGRLDGRQTRWMYKYLDVLNSSWNQQASTGSAGIATGPQAPAADGLSPISTTQLLALATRLGLVCPLTAKDVLEDAVRWRCECKRLRAHSERAVAQWLAHGRTTCPYCNCGDIRERKPAVDVSVSAQTLVRVVKSAPNTERFFALHTVRWARVSFRVTGLVFSRRVFILAHLPCRGPSFRCRKGQASEMLRFFGRMQT